MISVMNKPSICSVVALEIIDFSKKTETKQTEIRALLNNFIQQAIIDIPPENRQIAETANGATIACNGPLEDALEDAFFISINMRDEILKHNAHSATPLYVQFGINLGDAREVENTMVGEGVEEAKRIMSFAQANQILVSNVYFEMTSKITQEMAQMFEKYDMHAHEHEIYAVRLLKEATEAAPTALEDIADAEVRQTIASKINWNYIGLGFLALAAFFVLGKLVTSPNQPTITMEAPVVVEKPAEIMPAAEPAKLEPAPAAAAKPVENAPADVPKEAKPQEAKVVQKKTEKKPAEKSTENATDNATGKTETPAKSAEKSAETKAEKPATSDKSTWESVKDSVKSGTDRKCTQAEISMNQCNK